MTLVVIVLLSVFGCGLVFALYMLIRTEVVFRNQVAVCNAVHEYHKSRFEQGDYDFERLWDHVEEFDHTLWRLWDWGCTRILPPDKFELIKPFFGEGGRKMINETLLSVYSLEDLREMKVAVPCLLCETDVEMYISMADSRPCICDDCKSLWKTLKDSTKTTINMDPPTISETVELDFERERRKMMVDRYAREV